MRRPRMTTGAWIFATAALVLAVAAPVSYAAATSTVAIGNTTNGITASVDPEQQLLTASASAKNIVHFGVSVTSSCQTAYTPPAGKALMITSVGFDVGSGSANTESYITLADATCSHFYDFADTTQSFDAQRDVFPTGLPVSTLAVEGFNNGGDAAIVTGYLIPAAQLPTNLPGTPLPARVIKKIHAANH